ncbi:MAG TPA: class I SAM-dependent methyltransferase [candidate division Zixibacteria bacterium]|nr:class I SAM-dependent methyltransferase [candidate division Zixibacteria bacterium]
MSCTRLARPCVTSLPIEIIPIKSIKFAVCFQMKIGISLINDLSNIIEEFCNMNQNSNNFDEHRLPISKVYDQIAESFDTTRRYPWKDVIEFVEEISKKELVLDLGCGNGRHTKLILEKDTPTIGMDLSYNILQIALAKTLKQFQNLIPGMINADTIFLPFRKNSFDKIIMIAVIHHLDTDNKRALALREINNILKKNGQLLISCWLNTHPRFKKEDLAPLIAQNKQDILVPWTMTNGKKINRYYYLFDPKEFEELVLSSGLMIRLKRITNHNLFIIAQKK